MTTLTATEHQAYQDMPRLDLPVVNPDGTITEAWYRLILTLWLKTGSQTAVLGDAASLQNSIVISMKTLAAGVPLKAWSPLTGEEIGIVVIANVGGGPAIPVSTGGGSPLTYTATVDGSFLAESGKVELSRDAGATWYTVSQVGGTIPMLKDDKLRLTWYSTAPTCVYFPIKTS